MKKFIAALSILLVSTCVLAQEVKNNSIKDEDGDAPVLDAAYSLYGIAYSVSGVQSDYVYDVAHIRLHPGIKLSAGNVRGVFMFGIDQDFGRNGSSVTDSGTGFPLLPTMTSRFFVFPGILTLLKLRSIT